MTDACQESTSPDSGERQSNNLVSSSKFQGGGKGPGAGQWGGRTTAPTASMLPTWTLKHGAKGQFHTGSISLHWRDVMTYLKQTVQVECSQLRA